jgi:hypothetical protein
MQGSKRFCRLGVLPAAAAAAVFSGASKRYHWSASAVTASPCGGSEVYRLPQGPGGPCPCGHVARQPNVIGRGRGTA